jgi:hypothetical protein
MQCDILHWRSAKKWNGPAQKNERNGLFHKTQHAGSRMKPKESQPSASNKKFICPAGSVYRIHTGAEAAYIFRPAAIDLRRKKTLPCTHISLENANTFHRERCKSRSTRQRQKFAKVHCTLLLINFPFELGQTSILKINCPLD